MAEKELKLKVAEAIQDDVNKGIVRIDSGYLAEVDIKPGDIVEIEGEHKTVAIADRSYPGDIGLSIIRMDGIIRKNAKTGIGELVKIRKALVKEAEASGANIKADLSSFFKGEKYYIAECLEIPVVTQGITLDEVVGNLKEAVALHLEGEDLEQLGLSSKIRT